MAGTDDLVLCAEQRARLTPPHYPRSARYEPAWVLANMMGPHPLWLLEAACERLALRPGMRVLDLGCGKGLTSVFLAREFDVQVWATDLWIPASDNWARVRAAGLTQQVFPIHAEAHSLPFAHDFFDAVVSIDAYHYFGTNDLYLRQHLAPLVRPGGQFGIVIPGVRSELTEVPAHLKPFWEPDFHSFHSPQWWARQWRNANCLAAVEADLVPDGWRDWLAFQTLCVELKVGHGEQERRMLEADADRTLGFVRLTGTRG